MSVIEILQQLPDAIPYHDYSYTGYDGVTQHSVRKWCLYNYARFCAALKFITEKDGADGFTVVYCLSHPLFAIKYVAEMDYPVFKIFIGDNGIPNDKIICDDKNELKAFIASHSVAIKYAKATQNHALHFDMILHYASQYAWYMLRKDKENGTTEKV